ncbi:MAG: cytochrome c3 family protein [Omnitrophica WOR_2 bacterium]
MKHRYLIIVGVVLVAISLIIAACGSSTPTKPPPVLDTQAPAQQAATQVSTQTVATAAPVAGSAVTETVAAAPLKVPFEDQWASSPHADAKAEAFNHWNEADPKEVPVDCAKCHSTPGYQDFMGADGSAAGKVDKPAPIGTVITCEACHNDATVKLTSVVFPSGVEIKDLGSEARCMTCHQGRASKTTVDEAIKAQNLTDEDTPSDKLGFTNIHYLAAAATLYGNEVHGAYEYDGKTYDTKFRHVPGYDTCVSCHNTHSLKVNINDCKTCHTNVTDEASLQNIRMMGSEVDYNGNGDIKEGIAKEVEGLQSMLLTEIQNYGKEVAKTPIAYDAASYPYFFADANSNGKVDTDEKAFKAWTPRLLKAAYNYQTSIKDPGSFAHNAKYTIEYLYDSIEDLNTKSTTKVDLSKAHRVDAGHFQGTSEAFRHWDEEGVVPGGCSKCHSATGLPQFLSEAAMSSDTVTGNNVANPLSNGLACSTCHNDLTKFTRYTVDQVKFPSGSLVTFGKGVDANLCISCHQGRESTVSVNSAIQKSGAKDDEISDKLSFRNPHYFAAGATLFGTEAKGAYEYADQKYNGRNMHVEAMSTCNNCHDTHALRVKVEACTACHQNAKTEEELKNIRMSTTDYDGNGNNTEGIGVEIDNMTAALYKAIQEYAKTKNNAPIVYDAASYPYFFADANGNGQVDKDEKAYASWTPRLLRAAYNLQWVQKDPGTFAHNGKYIIQILYDSLKDLGADVSKMTRPEVTAPKTQ